MACHENLGFPYYAQHDCTPTDDETHWCSKTPPFTSRRLLGPELMAILHPSGSGAGPLTAYGKAAISSQSQAMLSMIRKDTPDSEINVPSPPNHQKHFGFVNIKGHCSIIMIKVMAPNEVFAFSLSLWNKDTETRCGFQPSKPRFRPPRSATDLHAIFR